MYTEYFSEIYTEIYVSSKNDRKTQINIEIRDFFLKSGGNIRYSVPPTAKSGGTCPPCPPPSDAHGYTPVSVEGINLIHIQLNLN